MKKAMMCTQCKELVVPKRMLGAGTWILALFTALISLLSISFYPRKCPKCANAAFIAATSDDNVLSSAHTPERLNKPTTKSRKSKLPLLLSLLFALGILSLFMPNLDNPRVASNRPVSPENNKLGCNDEVGAFVVSHEFVTRRLKSPSTAKFPRMATDGVRVTRSSECTFLVSSYVDSQNSFGATTRTKYLLEAKYNSKDKLWDLIRLETY